MASARSFSRSAVSGGRSEASHTFNQLRGQLAQANKRVRNLLDALADGVAVESDLFMEKVSNAEAEREELMRLIEGQEAQVKEALEPIGIDEARITSTKLKQLINAAPAELKKRYVRAFVSEIMVGKSEIVISGPKDALAEAVTGTPPAHIAAASGPVRSLVREWRTREDSNLRPPDS